MPHTAEEKVGQDATPTESFDEVLCLEQMLTPGGGWQDQVGGIKLASTQPEGCRSRFMSSRCGYRQRQKAGC